MPSEIPYQPIQQANPVQTASGILGLQQQRQALQTAQQDYQTGQATQQSAQAGAASATLANQKQQFVQSYMSNPANQGRDLEEMHKDLLAGAGDVGEGMYQKMVEGRRLQTNLKNEVMDLNTKQRGLAVTTLTPYSDPSNVQPNSAMAADIQNLADQDPSLAGVAHWIGQSSKMLPDPSTAKDPQTAAQMAAKRAQLIQGEILSYTGKNPSSATTVDKGSTIQPGQTGPLGSFTPTGDAIKKDLAPNQTPGYVAATTSAGKRAGGAAESDIERSNQVSATVQPSSAAIPLTQHIDDLADQIKSGKFAATISKAAAAAGMSESTYARQTLEKELGQVKSMATSGAGSDARAATILSGYPTAETDTKTIHTAMDLTRGTFRQNLARADQLNSLKSKDSSMQGAQHADDILTGSTTPLMHEFNALKTPAERSAFYSRNFGSAKEAEEFRNKVSGMKHALGQ